MFTPAETKPSSAQAQEPMASTPKVVSRSRNAGMVTPGVIYSPRNSRHGLLITPAAAQQAQLGGVRFHRVDDELNVLCELDAEVGGTARNIVTVDIAGKT